MRLYHICLPLLAGLLAAIFLPVVLPAQSEEPELPLGVRKLRQKLNPEYPSWSPEQVYERVAEHLAAFQTKLIRESGASTEKDLAHARKKAALEASYLTYFDFSDVPRNVHPQGIAALFFAANSSSASPSVYRPHPVPNCDNRLYYVDSRYLYWTDQVLEKIGEEDPYFREPLIPSESPALIYIKSVIGNKIYRASWFTYYNGDTTEFLKRGEVKADNAFYYQLLYASSEIEKDVEEEIEVEKKVTKYERRQVLINYGHYSQYEYRDYPVESVEKVTQKKKVKKKVPGAVPQNTKEFQAFWRVTSALKDAGDFFADRGAVIDEDRSQVSYANRIIQRVRTNLGTYYRTFDVFRTAGGQDFVERLPVPLKDKFDFDAGEHIFQTSKGSLVYLLTGGSADNEPRVEFGDPRVVRDQMSGHKLIVLTWKSCVACHEQGIIPLQNEVEILLKAGVKLNIRADKLVEKNAFYLQGLNRLVKVDNEEYAEFIRECNGLTPSENAAQYQRFRQWYIAPVTLAQAARECGAPVEEFMDAISVSAKGRIGRLLLDGRAIPRITWERGLYHEAFLLLMEYRKSVNVDRKARGLPPISLTSYTSPPPLIEE